MPPADFHAADVHHGVVGVEFTVCFLVRFLYAPYAFNEVLSRNKVYVDCRSVADEAEDGVAALNKLRNSKFDFVVTDINMPNMNGFDLLKAIKADDDLRHLPVLMVAAEARREDIVQAAQSGAAGYIVKPFTKATLEEKVAKIMERRSAA